MLCEHCAMDRRRYYCFEMMRMIKYMLLPSMLFFLFMGCSKDLPVASGGDEIVFRLNTPEVMLTKAEVTDDNIKTDATVKVYEALNSGGSLYDGSVLKPEVSDGNYTGVWKPEEANSTWTNYDFANMAFYGLAYSPSEAVGNGLTINSKGQVIIVSQPHTYDPSTTIDYLLSNSVSVPNDQAAGKVIPLNLEHAMSKVELYVYCADAMVSNDNQTIVITIEELNISRLYTDVTMIYSPQNDIEKWSRKDYGTADATYSNDNFSVVARTADMVANRAMSFIAVPVDQQDMEAELNIRYTVKVNSENPVEFSASFNLADYTPKGWMSNRKIKYELEIDTGINLTGTITDWVNVDYIEGIVLPEINTGSGSGSGTN